MASVKFYLKAPKEKSTSIYFLLNYGAFEILNNKKKYLPLKYYVNETINPIYWNSKLGRVKQDKRFPQHPEFNARLNSIEDMALSILRKLENDSVLITNDILREQLDLIYKINKDQTGRITNVEVISFAEHFTETSNRAVGTKKSYNRVIKDLQEYEKKNNTKLTFDRVDIDFYNSFIKYLQSKSYAPNTIGTRIKVLKTFMQDAYERGLHTNLDFQKKAFSKPTEDTTAVYLNDKELMKLYNADLKGNVTLDNVRQWFLIGAYTGLRFSDLSKLTKDNIQDGNINIKTQKTDTLVVVPLHPIVKAILEKNNYSLPKMISNQKFNKYIKEVAKLAKLTDAVGVDKTEGILKSRKTVEKHELVTAHTARRSFATNAFINGVPPIQIMLLTGHKTEKAFLGYIKISETENAKKLQLHPFFNKLIVK